MIERKTKRTARIGTFAVAHAKYWEQFEGLLDNIMGYHGDFVTKLSQNEVEVINYGMVDSSEKGYETVRKMRGDNLDLVMCNMVTYATSSVFAPVIRDLNVPMILVALQPREAMDYTKASTFMQLENDNICSVPEFMGVAERLGRKIHDVIIGTLYNDAEADAEVRKWCDIAKALNALSGARLGLMGHVLESMCDALPDGAWGKRMIMLDNWNEWDEGHFIAPNHKYGFGHLQAIREELTARDNLPDYRTPADFAFFNPTYRTKFMLKVRSSQLHYFPYNIIQQNSTKSNILFVKNIRMLKNWCI